jgi:hypothetical protein
VKFWVSIEPRWGAEGYLGECDIPDAELAGLDGEARAARIDELIRDFVGTQAPWGYGPADTADFRDAARQATAGFRPSAFLAERRRRRDGH